MRFFFHCEAQAGASQRRRRPNSAHLSMNMTTPSDVDSPENVAASPVSVSKSLIDALSLTVAAIRFRRRQAATARRDLAVKCGFLFFSVSIHPL